jgi:UDP-N-acetylmuramyl-tripeptide synthetase
MMDIAKKIIPESLLRAVRPWYHGLLAWDANIYFDRPSQQLIVVGITGTAGKSTTAAMLAHILNFAGFKTGYITTVNFFDGEKDFINKHGLSMPNEIKLQKQLHAMVINKCRVAIIECTSEGLAQNRHWGINFDMAVFTNFSNAHLEAHGSLENYRLAKGKLFSGIGKSRKKKFFPQKMVGVNLDDEEVDYFLSSPANKKFGVSFRRLEGGEAQKVFYGSLTKQGFPTEFQINSTPFVLNLPGNFNAQNAGLAVACANMLGVDLQKSAAALKSFSGVRGRMESVPNGRGINIIVDYGCEPASFKAALEAANAMPHNKLIHVFGSTGGHRDVAKRFEFGKTSAQFADRIIVTNDDVYGSNPQEIAANIEQGIRQVESGKKKVKNVETVLDRRLAIGRAISLAGKGNLVLITGKGSEQFLVLPGNKRIDWDDISVVREELGKLELGIKNYGI